MEISGYCKDCGHHFQASNNDCYIDRPCPNCDSSNVRYITDEHYDHFDYPLNTVED